MVSCNNVALSSHGSEHEHAEKCDLMADGHLFSLTSLNLKLVSLILYLCFFIKCVPTRWGLSASPVVDPSGHSTEQVFLNTDQQCPQSHFTRKLRSNYGSYVVDVHHWRHISRHECPGNSCNRRERNNRPIVKEASIKYHWAAFIGFNAAPPPTLCMYRQTDSLFKRFMRAKWDVWMCLQEVCQPPWMFFSEMYQNIVDLCRDVKRFSTNTKKKGF